MTSHVTRRRHQSLVLYPWLSEDVEGNPKVSAGIDLKVRHESGLAEALSPTSSNIGRQEVIVVDRKITVRSLICLGTVASPNLEFVGQVIDYVEVPDIKGRNKRREIVVMKYNNTKNTVIVLGGEFDKTEFNLSEFYV